MTLYTVPLAPLVVLLVLVPAWSQKGFSEGTRLVFSRRYWSREYWYFRPPGSPPRPRSRLRTIALTGIVIALGSVLFAIALVYVNQKLGWGAGLILGVLLAWPFGLAVSWAAARGRTRKSSNQR
jgi:hypothetical protein